MIPPEYRRPIIGLMLGAALWITSLYQLEIVDRNILVDLFTFDMPFYILSPMNIWVARDIWYLVNGISLALASYSGAIFNGKRTMLRYEKLSRLEAGKEEGKV